MNSLDILHYILVIGSIILVVTVIYTAYCFTKLIKTLQTFFDDIENAAKGVKAIGQASNLLVGSLIKKLLAGNRKGKHLQRVIQKPR